MSREWTLQEIVIIAKPHVTTHAHLLNSLPKGNAQAKGRTQYTESI